MWPLPQPLRTVLRLDCYWMLRPVKEVSPADRMRWPCYPPPRSGARPFASCLAVETVWMVERALLAGLSQEVFASSGKLDTALQPFLDTVLEGRVAG